jgi:LysR family transcriptional regulator for bpeEF and oprC
MSGFSQFLAFACVARHGSFADAGRELGVTPSTVAKRIVRLEEGLGVKLFHRTTRQVKLTADGEALYARCEKILADIDELETFAGGANHEPRGELRITVPITYGKQVVLPVVADLLQKHPDMSADVRLSDQFCDLIKEGMDAAVRVMPLNDSRLVGRQVDVQHLLVCASPNYLARHGTPAHPLQLDAHQFIFFRNPSSGRARPLAFLVNGESLSLSPPRRLLLNDGEAVVQAVRLGTGIAQVPDVMVAEELARGTLVEVLVAFKPPAVPISIVWPGNRLMPARVRAFINAFRVRQSEIEQRSLRCK